MNRLKIMAKCDGHTVKKNQSVNLALSCQYEQLPNVVQLTVALNVDVEVAVQEADKVVRLGTARVQKIVIDSDGTSAITLNSMAEFIEFDVLGFMSSNQDEDFTVYFKWDLEV